LRLVTSNSVEETILARAQYKLDIDGKVIQAGKFDNKTSDREREELLRSLFGAEDEEVDEKQVEREGEIDDNDLNEIIARNEEELEIYTKMDEERRAAEQRSFEQYGGKGQMPSRLMGLDELPAVLLADPDNDKPIEEAFTGRGARARKEVAYDDGLNEDQWTNAVDEGDLTGFIAKKKARQAELHKEKELRAEDHQHRRDQGEFVDSDEDDMYIDQNPLELPDPEPEPPKRKRVSDVGASKKKRGRTPKKHFAGVDPNLEDQKTPEMRERLTQMFLSCYKAVESASVQTDG
jgi:ATP-dependent helicase STH1/SNF2